MSEGQEPGNDSEAETAGVDVTLIEEMLRLSPAERLQQNDRMASLAAKLRSAFRDGGHAMAEPRDLTSLIEALLDEKVDFVLVGAPAAIAQGAPVTTHDVEIVHARTPENLDR